MKIALIQGHGGSQILFNTILRVLSWPNKGAEVIVSMEEVSGDPTQPSMYNGRLLKEVLKQMEHPAVEYLCYALTDEDKWIRYAAAEALGTIGDKRCVDSLIAALRDTDQEVRLAALKSLLKIGKLGDARALNAIIESFARY